MGELKMIPKDGDGDDGTCEVESVVISVCDNGFKVKVADAEGEEELVYRRGRDDYELIADIKEYLGIGG